MFHLSCTKKIYYSLILKYIEKNIIHKEKILNYWI